MLVHQRVSPHHPSHGPRIETMMTCVWKWAMQRIGAAGGRCEPQNDYLRSSNRPLGHILPLAVTDYS